MDGIILINKPKECTSHDVVNKVKHLLKVKVGHAGTLDPNATGLLPILIGKGTKLSYYLIGHDKEYEVILELGKKTDTADAEGNILEVQNVDKSILNEGNVAQVLNGFIGKQKQVPPMYSAIKVKGKKLYEYARKDIKLEIEPRDIEIYDIKLTRINQDENTISFTVQCSKGTYIRSLCEDIAKSLGTIGFMKELNRTKIGILNNANESKTNYTFDIKNSITINDLEQNIDNQDYLLNHIISIEEFFKLAYGKENNICLNNRKLELFLNGVKLSFDEEEGLYRIYNHEKEFIGIGSIKERFLKREIV